MLAFLPKKSRLKMKTTKKGYHKKEERDGLN